MDLKVLVGRSVIMFSSGTYLIDKRFLQSPLKFWASFSKTFQVLYHVRYIIYAEMLENVPSGALRRLQRVDWWSLFVTFGQFHLPSLFMTRKRVVVLILLLTITKQANCISRLSDFKERQHGRWVEERQPPFGIHKLLCGSNFISFARLGEAWSLFLHTVMSQLSPGNL